MPKNESFGQKNKKNLKNHDLKITIFEPIFRDIQILNIIKIYWLSSI